MNHVVENKPRSEIISSHKHHKVSRAYYLPCFGDPKRVVLLSFAKHRISKCEQFRNYFK